MYYCTACNARTEDRKTLYRHLLLKHPIGKTDKLRRDAITIQRLLIYNQNHEYNKIHSRLITQLSDL